MPFDPSLRMAGKSTYFEQARPWFIIITSLVAVMFVIGIVLMSLSIATFVKVQPGSDQLSARCKKALDTAVLFHTLESANNFNDAFALIDGNFTLNFHCSGVPTGGSWSGFDPQNPRSAYGYLYNEFFYTEQVNYSIATVRAVDCDSQTFSVVFFRNTFYRCDPSDAQVSSKITTEVTCYTRVSANTGKVTSLNFWGDCTPIANFFRDTCAVNFAEVASATVQQNMPKDMVQSVALEAHL